MKQNSFKRREVMAGIPVALAASAIGVEATPAEHDPVAVAWKSLQASIAE